MQTKKTYQFGILAEKIAIIFLWLKGYQILAWRYKTRFGEIDIVARKGKTIVAVEVKARKLKTDFFEVVSDRQLERIESALQIFVKRNWRFKNQATRIDLICVNRFLMPRHFKKIEY